MTDNKLNIKSYAIFIRGSYGDLLMTDPLIKLIKGLNLNNKITLFVDENNYQLVQFMENIDSFIKMPSKGNRYLFFMYFGLKNRKNKYDVSIAAKTGVGSENGFFQFMLGAKKQISYISRKKSWTDRLINSPIIFEEDLYHKQHYALGVLQLLDAKFKTIPKPLLPKLKTNIKKTKTKHVKILISTSNNRVYSQLDIEKIAEIINQICGEFQLKIYISCMEKDKEIAHKLNQLITHPSKTYSTRTFIDFINAF